MSVKKLIILAVLLVAVGVYYYFDQKAVDQAEQDEQKAKKLFAFDLADVSRVRIEREGEVIVADRAGEDAWKIVEPYEAPGDKSTLRTLVSGFANAEIQKRVESVEDFAKYGLADPKVKVTLEIGDASGEHTILLGNQIPSGADYFAQRDGEDTVLTVNSYLYSNANKGLFDFLDKSLVDFEVDDVRTFEVLGKDSTVALEIPEKNRARMLQPEEMKASYTNVNSLLWKVKNARVVRFGPRDVPDADLATYGLVDPATRVVLGFGEKGSDRSYKSLNIGDATEEEGKTRYWALREGDDDLLLIEESTVRDMIANPNKIRAEKLIQTREWDVDYFELERPGEKIVLSRDEDGNWTMTSPDELPGKADGVHSLVKKFSGYQDFFKIGDYISDATDMGRYHLDAPLYSLTVKSKGTEETVHITDVIAEIDAEGTTVRRVYAQWADYPGLVLVMQASGPIEDVLQTDLTEFAEYPTPTPLPTATPQPEPAPEQDTTEDSSSVAPGGEAGGETKAREPSGPAEETGAVAPAPGDATGE